MKLSETGESRVRGYLYVLERSLRTFLPGGVTSDAVREVESHIRERVLSAEPMPNERDALEQILTELGPPLQVARAYSDELQVDEALATGRVVSLGRAVLRLASTGVSAFFFAIAVFVGYAIALGFAAMAVLQPIFPENVGIWMQNGVPFAFGAQFPRPDDMQLIGGYWIIPVSVTCAMLVLFGTHRAARAWLRRWRERRAPFARTA